MVFIISLLNIYVRCGGGTEGGINCTPDTKYDLFTAGLRFYLKFIFKSIRPLKLLKGFQPANLFINIFSAECLGEKKKIREISCLVPKTEKMEAHVFNFPKVIQPCWKSGGNVCKIKQQYISLYPFLLISVEEDYSIFKGKISSIITNPNTSNVMFN